MQPPTVPCRIGTSRVPFGIRDHGALVSAGSYAASVGAVWALLSVRRANVVSVFGVNTGVWSE